MEKPENVPEAPLDLSKFVPISHDMFFREMFSDPEFAQAFLRKILKSEAVELLNLEMLEVLPTTFLTREFRELRADVIYRVPLKNGEKIVPGGNF